MKKFILLAVIFILAACQTMPEKGKENASSKNNFSIMAVNCNGFSDWSDCYKVAARVCPNGFDIIQQESDHVRGVRKLTYACK